MQSSNTTAGNTEHKNGSFTLLRQKLRNDFSWLVCLYHKSSGKNVKLFTICNSTGLILTSSMRAIAMTTVSVMTFSNNSNGYLPPAFPDAAVLVAGAETS